MFDRNKYLELKTSLARVGIDVIVEADIEKDPVLAFGNGEVQIMTSESIEYVETGVLCYYQPDDEHRYGFAVFSMKSLEVLLVKLLTK